MRPVVVPVVLPGGSAVALGGAAVQQQGAAGGQLHALVVLLDQTGAGQRIKQQITFLIGTGRGKMGAAIKVAGLGAVKRLCQRRRAGGGAQPGAAFLHVHIIGQHSGGPSLAYMNMIETNRAFVNKK